MAKIKDFPRPGAWAVDGTGRVGLLFRADLKDGQTREEFHVVNEAGETRLIQIRPWVPSDELRAARGAVLRSRREDGTRIEEFVAEAALGAEDADLPVEDYPFAALSIAPAAALPPARIAGLDRETLAAMGYV